MSARALIAGAAEAAWLRRAGLRLGPEEALRFLEAAEVLLPRGRALAAAARAGRPPTGVQRREVRALWLESGAPPAAPVAMPLHPLAPGLLAATWRRLHEASAHPPRTEAE